MKVEWEPFAAYTESVKGFRGDISTKNIPAGLESSSSHQSQMEALASKPGKVVRKDGNPDAAFKNAVKVIPLVTVWLVSDHRRSPTALAS